MTLATFIQDTTLTCSGRYIEHVDLQCEVELTEGNYSKDPGWRADPEAGVEGKVKVTDGQTFTAEEMAEIQALVEADVESDPEHVAFSLGLCE